MNCSRLRYSLNDYFYLNLDLERYRPTEQRSIKNEVAWTNGLRFQSVPMSHYLSITTSH